MGILTKPSTIIIPTDGSEFSEGAIREGIELAKNSSSKIRALYVIEFNPEYESLAPNLAEKEEKTAQDTLKALKERAEKEGVECTALMIRNEFPYRAIVDEAESSGASLIVMGRRGRTGIKRLLMGSVTAKVIGHSKVDVLVVPRAAEITCKNILTATDGSIYAKNSIKVASEIAKSCGASLNIISVILSENISLPDITRVETQRELILESALKDAEKNISEAKDIASGIGVSAKDIIAAGRPFEQIVEASKQINADLIVLGSYGKTGLTKALMGSVTEKVIGLASCATLVIVKGAVPPV